MICFEKGSVRHLKISSEITEDVESTLKKIKMPIGSNNVETTSLPIDFS